MCGYAVQGPSRLPKDESDGGKLFADRLYPSRASPAGRVSSLAVKASKGWWGFSSSRC